MNIGAASERSGLPPKTIRYYEEIGLVKPARRPNGYRDYAQTDVANLRFVARARALGFGIDECRALLSLYADESRASADVRLLAEEHVAEIERKIAELEEMKAVLARLISACHGDRRPECPILDDLAQAPGGIAGAAGTAGQRRRN